MLKAAAAKIKSALKRRDVVVKSLFVLLAFAALVAPYFLPQRAPSNHIKLEAGTKTFYVEKVAEEAARQKGLSGRAELAPDRGMLFVFHTAEPQCFWMKDMRFSIDIIWLDAQKIIQQVAANVSPKTYPKSFCYDEPSTYVLELQAGQAADSGLKPGVRLQF